MKVILKGGSSKKNEEIKNFFIEKIFSILDFGITIESSTNIITVYEKKNGGEVTECINPTAEVIVKLTDEARNLAINLFIPNEYLEKISGNFFDEAKAIIKIKKLQPLFSVKYYSCGYTYH